MYYTLCIVAPNGIRANLASLKCCMANGIPIIVTHNNRPHIKCPTASSMPQTSIHIIFPNAPITPNPPGVISRPNGQKTNPAILKHWTPKGMPMMVTQSRRPIIAHISDIIIPPRINQSKFPISFNKTHPSFS